MQRTAKFPTMVTKGALDDRFDQNTIHTSPKQSRPNSINYLKQTPIFEWCVLRCGSKNGHQKDIMHFKEIGLRAQNLLTILGSIFNMIGGPIFAFIMT